jgi:hypothetical protein
MRRHIRAQTIKMAVVMLGIVAITVFAWDFVYTGLKAKLALNGGIWLVFLFGIFMSFLTVVRLRNEQLAFAALAEAYEDIKEGRVRAATDPYWRHYRCLSPGTVFVRPRLLGHVFEIVYEEMQRSRKLRISVGTMQSLVHGVEEKLAEERSLVTYLSGLLVFLGLIGAFIGLIQMVASVGGIIGSLGGASGPGVDTSAMFGKLIGELQGPLKGMSVGFSSSLFGLSGSLILGLMGRFAGQAGTALKAEFESWLSNVAQIEDGHDEEIVVATTGDPRLGQEVTAALAGIARTVSLSASGAERMVEAVEKMTQLQKEQAEAAAKASAALERLVAGQDDLRVNIARAAAHLGHLSVAKDDMLKAGTGIEGKLDAGFGRMEQSLTALAKAHTAVDMRPVEIAVRESFAGGFEQLAAVLERSATAQTQELGRLVASAPVSGQAIRDAVADGAIEDIRQRTERLETGITTGLSDVARAMEANFLAYSQLLSAAAAAPASAAAVTPAPPDKLEPHEPVDQEAMMRRLYSRIAEQYRGTGTTP